MEKRRKLRRRRVFMQIWNLKLTCQFELLLQRRVENGRVIVKDQLRRICKEVVMTCLEIISWHLLERQNKTSRWSIFVGLLFHELQSTKLYTFNRHSTQWTHERQLKQWPYANSSHIWYRPRERHLHLTLTIHRAARALVWMKKVLWLQRVCRGVGCIWAGPSWKPPLRPQSFCLDLLW
jgi:hypothetical protein